MATVTETSATTKPITVAAPDVDPWYADRPAYAVDKADLAFGARIRHKVVGGVWKVVRGPERQDSTRRFAIRVREQGDNGSLFGPVLSWKLDEVAGLVADEPGPAEVEIASETISPAIPSPAPVVEQVGTFSPVWYAAARVVTMGDACWMPPRSRVEAMVQRDAIRHELARIRAGLDDATLDARAAHDDACEAAAARDAYNDHREKLAELEVAEAAVRREGEARQVEPVPCCEPAEVSPCIACEPIPAPLPDDDGHWTDDLDVGAIETSRDDEDESWRYGPQDDDGVGWDAYADDRWTISESAPEPDPDRLRLAERIEVEARHYRTLGTDFGDLLAETIAKLAAEVRWLDATTPAGYRDGRDAMLDCAAVEAEARAAALC